MVVSFAELSLEVGQYESNKISRFYALTPEITHLGRFSNCMVRYSRKVVGVIEPNLSHGFVRFLRTGGMRQRPVNSWTPDGSVPRVRGGGATFASTSDPPSVWMFESSRPHSQPMFGGMCRPGDFNSNVDIYCFRRIMFGLRYGRKGDLFSPRAPHLFEGARLWHLPRGTSRIHVVSNFTKCRPPTTTAATPGHPTFTLPLFIFDPPPYPTMMKTIFALLALFASASAFVPSQSGASGSKTDARWRMSGRRGRRCAGGGVGAT